MEICEYVIERDKIGAPEKFSVISFPAEYLTF